MVKKKDTTEERIVAVEEALSKSEQFIERNQKILTYVVGGIIVVILLFFGYKKYISGPKEKTAQSLSCFLFNNISLFQQQVYRTI